MKFGGSGRTRTPKALRPTRVQTGALIQPDRFQKLAEDGGVEPQASYETPAAFQAVLVPNEIIFLAKHD